MHDLIDFCKRQSYNTDDHIDTPVEHICYSHAYSHEGLYK